jgi:hypothetical protein
MRTTAAITAIVAAATAAILLAWDGPIEVAAYEAVLLIVGIGAFVALSRPGEVRSEPAPLHVRARRPKPQRPPQLEEIERLVSFGTTTAFDADWRLLPLLRDLARGRLRDHHRIDLDTEPAAARRYLGDVAWEFLRPGYQPRPNRLGPGITLEELDSVIAAVDGL